MVRGSPSVGWGTMRGQPRGTQHTLARYGDGQDVADHASSEHGQCMSVPCSGNPAMPFQASEVSSCTAVSRGTWLSEDSQ